MSSWQHLHLHSGFLLLDIDDGGAEEDDQDEDQLELGAELLVDEEGWCDELDDELLDEELDDELLEDELLDDEWEDDEDEWDDEELDAGEELLDEDIVPSLLNQRRGNFQAHHYLLRWRINVK